MCKSMREFFLWGPLKFIIFGESVEQGVAFYKCGARSHASLSLSLANHVVSEEGLQGLRDANAFFALVVLEQRCYDTRERKG